MMHLEWVLTCAKCKKEHREKAKHLDLIFDSDPVQVRLPQVKDWQTDGLGGWMCKKCYDEWSNEK